MDKNYENLVYLEPIEHVYIHRKTGKKYTSVTKTLQSIEPHFDAEAVSAAIVRQPDNVKQERYIGMNQTQILDYWQMLNDEANTYGTKVHDFIERYLKANKWLFTEDELENKIITGYNSLKVDEGIAMHPERIMFSEEYELAGMSDLVIDIDDVFFDVGDWKGLSVDTPIFTDNGWKTMGTLTKQDKVYDMNGELTNIIHLSNVKNKPCYEIKFDNNETIVADYEHRWLISFYRNKRYKDIVMTTKEIFDYLNNLNSSNKRWSQKLPKVKICKPLNNKDISLPIDPYVLGVWLGDGHNADSKITNMHDNVWSEIEKRGYNIGSDISGGSGKAKTRTIFGMRSKLRSLNLLYNKHLPDLYLKSSFEQRLDLLRGFMDADGYYNRIRKRFSMSTTRKWQVDALTKIASSLGIKITILPIKKKFSEKIIDVYDICFSTDSLNPFLSRNQNDMIYSTKSGHFFKNIETIKPVESVPTRCIEVDSPTHTFLYGNTFSITHNTNRVFNFYNPFGYQTLLKPFEHLQNCQWSIYSIQLSVYALMYEMETGRKCRHIWIGYWDKITETFTKVPIMYLKKEAKQVMEMHRYNLLAA